MDQSGRRTSSLSCPRTRRPFFPVEAKKGVEKRGGFSLRQKALWMSHICKIWQATWELSQTPQALSFLHSLSLSIRSTRDDEQSLCVERSGITRWRLDAAARELKAQCSGLTLPPLMSDTSVLTEAKGSYLVMEVDTGCYWARRHSRVDTDLLFNELRQGMGTRQQLVHHNTTLCTHWAHMSWRIYSAKYLDAVICFFWSSS